ncbi:hypothetical protein OPU71_05850 [Niveibacterium sp. 24ML]|uniref:hypothetical protein n=1 Tax=Niveibacterium sp. 24ML TaxID=2985512 RepID=UPI00226E3A98|nr:hypothetical protein [Niveibacterium sp. 24ML]MCX9155646.1 hypothetical protein [Niveibacterium sp. 24ML]
MRNPYSGVSPKRLVWSLVAAGAAIAIVSAMPSCEDGRLELANAVSHCRNVTRFDPNQRSALSSTKAFVACVDHKAGKAGRPYFAEQRALFEALPNHPCEYVGIWAATRGDQHYRMVLDEDGSFRGQAYADSRAVYGGMTGNWGVAAGKLVWMYDKGLTWPPDANPIVPQGQGSFLLREVDGSTTRYDLLDRSVFERCPAEG